MRKATAANIEETIEIFCNAIIKGHTQGEAYRISHPQCRKTGCALRVEGYEFSHRPDVMERLEELRAEMRERHANFRDRLVDHLCVEIEQCWEDYATLAPVMKQVDTATRVLGMDKQVVDMNAKLGPIDDDSAAEKINFLVKKAGGKGKTK